jgi:hypothetical protein
MGRRVVFEYGLLAELGQVVVRVLAVREHYVGLVAHVRTLMRKQRGQMLWIHCQLSVHALLRTYSHLRRFRLHAGSAILLTCIHTSVEPPSHKVTCVTATQDR